MSNRLDQELSNEFRCKIAQRNELEIGSRYLRVSDKRAHWQQAKTCLSSVFVQSSGASMFQFVFLVLDITNFLENFWYLFPLHLTESR